MIQKRLGALSANDYNSERLIDALVEAHPPVALSHQGVNFVKQALTELQAKGDLGCAQYIKAICTTGPGSVVSAWYDFCEADESRRTPGLVSIASTAVGKQHLGQHRLPLSGLG